MKHSHTFRVWGQGTGVRGDKGLSYHMRHSHTFRVYGGDRGQGTGVARLQRPAAEVETSIFHRAKAC